MRKSTYKNLDIPTVVRIKEHNAKLTIIITPTIKDKLLSSFITFVWGYGCYYIFISKLQSFNLIYSLVGLLFILSTLALTVMTLATLLGKTTYILSNQGIEYKVRALKIIKKTTYQWTEITNIKTEPYHRSKNKEMNSIMIIAKGKENMSGTFKQKTTIFVQNVIYMFFEKYNQSL